MINSSEQENFCHVT